MSETPEFPAVMPPALPEHATADPAVVAVEAATPDPSAAISEEQTADWRQAATAEHFNDLPDSIKAEMKATGDTMEPGYMKLRRAKEEAGQRLAASDAYHEHALDADSRDAGQAAHDRALAEARAQIAANVETAYNQAVTDNMSDQTKALLHQGLQNRFEREAQDSAVAAGESARAARVAHVHENGGAPALERLKAGEENERYMRRVLGDAEYDRRRDARETAAATETSSDELPPAPDFGHEDEDPFAMADRLDAERTARINHEEAAAESTGDDLWLPLPAGADESTEPVESAPAEAEEAEPFDPTRPLSADEVADLSPEQFNEYLPAHQNENRDGHRDFGDAVGDANGEPWTPAPAKSSDGEAHGDSSHEGEPETEEQRKQREANAAYAAEVDDEYRKILDKIGTSDEQLAAMSKRKRRELLDEAYNSLYGENNEDPTDAQHQAFRRLLDTLSPKDKYDYLRKSNHSWEARDIADAKKRMQDESGEGENAANAGRRRIRDKFLGTGVALENIDRNPESSRRRRIIIAGVAGVLAVGVVAYGLYDLFHGGSGATALGGGNMGGGASNPGDKAAILNHFTSAQGGGASGGTSGVETMTLGHFDTSNPNGDGTVSGLALKALHERGIADPTAAQIHHASDIIANANGYAGDSYTNEAMRSLAEGQTFNIPQDLGQ